MSKPRKVAIPSLEEDAKIVAAALADADSQPLSATASTKLFSAESTSAKAARMKKVSTGGMVEIRSGRAYRIVAIPEDIASRLTDDDQDLEKQVNDTLRRAVGL
jgi:hypothetical protein